MQNISARNGSDAASNQGISRGSTYSATTDCRTNFVRNGGAKFLNSASYNRSFNDLFGAASSISGNKTGG